jgi:ATP/maltotriose-dependent transcriptional regulator MalT
LQHVQNLVPRPRLRELIASGGRRVKLIGAPAGYGKSCALQDYARAQDAVYVRLAPRTSLAQFSHELGQALSVYASGLRSALVGAYTRAQQSVDPPASLAGWFLRHLAGVSCKIVLDDVHHAADFAVTRFVIEMVERSPSCTWVIASEHLDELPIPSWLARDVTGYPFHPFRLCVTPEEAQAFARHFGFAGEAKRLQLLLEATSGVVAPFVFALRAPQKLIDERGEAGGMETLAERIFGQFSPSERDVILRTSMLPSLEDDAVGKLLGPQGPARLAALRASAPYIFEPHRPSYQTCFASFLRAHLAEHGSREELIATAALALEAAGDLATSLRLLASIGHEREILAIVDRHGFASLESNYALTLHDAIANLSEGARSSSPVALTIAGMAASLGNQLDVSESCYKKALEACTDEVQRCGVRYWWGADRMRRGRTDAIEILEGAHGDAPGLSTFLRVATQSALAAAYAMRGEDAAASARMEPILREVETLESEMLRARVYHQAAYIAMRATRYAEAKQLAHRAVELAERAGAYETVAGALSILHNVAVVLDENFANATEYLRQIGEYGAKLGSVDKQLFALANAFEIEVERGDEEAATALEEELRAFDVRYDTHAASQAVLPAQVLQLAWRGDFARAYRILKPTGDQQLDAGRRALRWAEIALYAAAAGVRGDASAAMRRCEQQLAIAGPGEGHGWRARAYLALSALLLGHDDAARAALASIGADVSAAPERMRRLIEFVSHLVMQRAGVLEPHTVLRALEALYERGLGGFARMFEALPVDLISPTPRKAVA